MTSGFDPVPSDRLEVTSETGAALTDFDYRVAASLLKLTHSLRWPKDTLSYLTERIGLDGLQIPVSQLSGFTQFTMNYSPNIGDETLAPNGPFIAGTPDPGPSLLGLPDGTYFIMVRANAKSDAATGIALMSVKVNTTEATDATGFQMVGTDRNTHIGLSVQTLKNADNNTLEARYRGAIAGTASFSNRQLYALLVSNL